MDNSTIERLLRNHPITRKRFGGVFARDTLPTTTETKKKNSDCFYVVNLDSRNEPGSHWVVLHTCGGRHQSEYFDSYGWPPQKKEFIKFMKDKYIHSVKELQHPFSTVCGQWCMFFILLRCRGKSMREIINLFTCKNKIANDLMVNAAVEQEFKTDQDVIDKKFIRDHMKSASRKNVPKLFSTNG